MQRITFEINEELKADLAKECVLTNVKIKGFITGLFKAYLLSSESNKESLRKQIREIK